MDRLEAKDNPLAFSQQLAANLLGLALQFDQIFPAKDGQLPGLDRNITKRTEHAIIKLAEALSSNDHQALEAALHDLLSAISSTVTAFGFLGAENSQIATAYIIKSCTILQKIAIATQNLAIEKTFFENLLLDHSSGTANTISRYYGYLSKSYVDCLHNNPKPVYSLRGHVTANYGEVPPTFIPSAKIAPVDDEVTRIRTELGIGADSKAALRAQAASVKVEVPPANPVPPDLMSAMLAFTEAQPPSSAKPIHPPSAKISSPPAAPTPAPRTVERQTLPKSLPPATPPTIAKTSRSTRKAIYFAFAAVLGLAGLSAVISKTTSKQSTADSSTQVASTSTAKPAPRLAVTPASPEAAPEKGIFKVATNHASFKNYLSQIHQATGLVIMIKDIAGQTKLDYFQNPAEAKAARDKGIRALSGTESELAQRIAIAEAFLDQALHQNISNRWTVSFFEMQKAAMATFQSTGNWDATAISNGADKFFAAFQLPQKFTAPPQVIGYAPDINPDTNPALKALQKAAPTFKSAFVKAAQQMQTETDPTRIVRFDDFNMLKTETCQRILAIGRADKNSHVRSGIGHLHTAWCKGTANPYNALNAALKFTVQIKKPAPSPTTPTTPQLQSTSGSIPNTIIPLHQSKFPNAQPSPSAKPPAKPGFFSRAKSFFGIGKTRDKADHLPPLSQSQPAFTRKDIPMYSWKKTLKNYFLG